MRGSLALRHGARTTTDPYLWYRLAPEHDDGVARTNRLGLRGKDVATTVDDATFRVLLLGGSVAFGFTSPHEDDTIGAYLAHELSDRAAASPTLRGRRIEVLNGGVPAYVAWQGALAYATRYRDLTPDVVMSLDGTNEVAAAIQTGRPGWPMYFDPTGARYDPDDPDLGRVLGDWLRARARRLKLARYLAREEPAELSEYAPPEPADVVAAYRGALELLADLGGADGALVVPVLQPMAILPDAKPLTSVESQLAADFERQLPGASRYYARNYQAFRAMFAELGVERPEVVALDATRVFQGHAELVFTDHCHLTPGGRRILARAMGEALVAHLDGAAKPAPR